MADRIQYLMDQQSQTFKKLKDADVFSDHEVKDIVIRRKNYEYLIRRRQLQPIQYFKYLYYEINLDKLLNIRLANFIKSKSGRHNEIRSILSLSVQHICSVFARGIRQYPDITELWNYYISFLKYKKSNVLLGKVFGKALSLHPRLEQFWTQAVAFELNVNNNFYASRILLQRSLRFNPTSEVLWSYYFDVECVNNLKIIQRQKALNIDVDYSLSEGTSTVVYKHAITSIPNSEFACKLYESSLRILGYGYTSKILEKMAFDFFGHSESLIKNVLTIQLKTVTSDKNITRSSSNIQFASLCADIMQKCLDVIFEYVLNQSRFDAQDIEKSVFCCDLMIVSMECVHKILQRQHLILNSVEDVHVSSPSFISLKISLLKCADILANLKRQLQSGDFPKTLNSYDDVKLNNVMMRCELYIWNISMLFSIDLDLSVLDIRNSKIENICVTFLERIVKCGRKLCQMQKCFQYHPLVTISSKGFCEVVTASNLWSNTVSLFLKMVVQVRNRGTFFVEMYCDSQFNNLVDSILAMLLECISLLSVAKLDELFTEHFMIALLGRCDYAKIEQFLRRLILNNAMSVQGRVLFFSFYFRLLENHNIPITNLLDASIGGVCNNTFCVKLRGKKHTIGSLEDSFDWFQSVFALTDNIFFNGEPLQSVILIEPLGRYFLSLCSLNVKLMQRYRNCPSNRVLNFCQKIIKFLKEFCNSNCLNDLLVLHESIKANCVQ